MDPLEVSLRILHIVFGVLWAGTIFFSTLFLEPRLRALGPSIERPVMGALLPRLMPAMMASSVITIGTGAAMGLIDRWGYLDGFLGSGWGWAMLIGFVTTVGAAVVGFGMITPVGMRMERLARAIGERAPSPEEARQLKGFSNRIQALSRTNFVLVLIAVGAMAAARYV